MNCRMKGCIQLLPPYPNYTILLHTACMLGMLALSAAVPSSTRAEDIDCSILAEPPRATETEISLPPIEAWQVTSRDQNSTTHEFFESVTNTQGQVQIKPHRVIKLASGLNYQDSDGQWKESVPEIQLAKDGSACATRGAHTLRLSPNLNTEGAIVLTTSKRTYKSHILGLYYFDPLSGKSVRISGLRDSVGEIHPPNQVVWRSAFESVAADIRVTYDIAGIELDMILSELPPAPSAFGLSPQSRIELWHEFICDTTTPNRTTVTAKTYSHPELPLTDEILDFGDLWFPIGRAYACQGLQRSSTTPAQIRLSPPSTDGTDLHVAKTWTVINNRSVLVEALAWADVARLGAGLPKSTWGLTASETEATTGRQLPEPPRTVADSGAPMRVAEVPYQATGFLWDYIAVANSGVNQVFENQANGTYLVSGGAYYTGTLTFQAGCVIKYDYLAYLLTTGTVYCQGTATSPSVLTSRADPRFGEVTPNSCPESNYIQCGLWLYNMYSPSTVHHMRICYAIVALRLDQHRFPDVWHHSLENIRTEFCQVDCQPVQCPYSWQNCTSVDVANPMFTPMQSLAGHIVANTQALAVNHDRNNWGHQIFSGSGTSLNPWGWLYNVPGFNSVGTDPNEVGCTLVTDRHALAAWHMAHDANDLSTFPGRTFKFVGRDNVAHYTVCQGAQRPTFYPDVAVLAFDPPLPPSVDVAKILPASASRKLPQSFNSNLPYNCRAKNVPAIAACLTVSKGTHALDLSGLNLDGRLFYTTDHFTPEGWMWMKNWSLPSWEGPTFWGDCGHPIWFAINNGSAIELVYVGTYHWGPTSPPQTNTGPWSGNYQDQLQSAITTLQSTTGVESRNVTLFDLSGFPDLD